MFTTWIRVEDAYGQFDHPKGQRLPKGVTVVEGYPEHRGTIARATKPKVDLRVETESLGSKRKPELVEIVEGLGLEVDPKATKKDLLDQIEAHNAPPADQVDVDEVDDEDPDGTESSDTGDTTTTDAGTPGAGQE